MVKRIETGEVVWFIDLDNKQFMDLPRQDEHKKDWANWTKFTEFQINLNGFKLVTQSGKTIRVVTR